MTDYASILSQNATLVAQRAAAATAAATTNSTTTTGTATTGTAATAAASTASASTTSASSAFASLSSDENFFLTMLTTQLQNQDPTQPMDVSQMTSQIAQYSGVEQQVETNANLEKMLASSTQSSAATAVGYIGEEVESEGTSSQVVAGQGAFAYMLPTAADTATISIEDSTGAVVFTGAGTTKEGRNLVVWDGVNSSTGEQEPDGMYTLSVKAVDSSGTAITPDIRAVGIVSGVETASDGTVQLDVGTTQVPLTSVLAVRAPTRIASTSTTGTTATDTSGTGTGGSADASS